MARKTRFTTVGGYTYTKNKYEELRRAVTNFNRRLARKKIKLDLDLQEILPEKVSFSKVRQQVSNARDVNKLIRRLNSFRGESFDLVENPYGVGYTTRGQLKIARQEARTENQRRARLRELVQRGVENEGRLPVDQDSTMRDIEPKDLLDREDPLAIDMYGRRISEQTVAWQKNYLASIERAKAEIWISVSPDRDLYTYLAGQLDLVAEMVRGLTPEQFYYAQMLFPEISIGVITDIPLLIQTIEEIVQTWTYFVNSNPVTGEILE